MTSRASIQRNFNVVTSNFCIVKAYQTIRVRNLEIHDYYRPPTKLPEGNAFISVCHSVQAVGGYIWSHVLSLGGISGTRSLRGEYVGRVRVCPKGVGYVQGVSTHHLGHGTSGGWVCPVDTHPPDTAYNGIQSQAVGTHPTRMLSCSDSNLCPIYL